MARTPSAMVSLGTYAHQFSLIDITTGNIFNLTQPPNAQITVIMFICNHCPFVKHITNELTRLAQNYIPQGVLFLAINSNDATQYPDDSPENMKHLAQACKFPFPYLYDETQEVAQAYQAACTPDFFIYDKQMRLAYRGQLDDSRPGNTIEVDGSSIRKALDCLLSNQPVPTLQKPSLGCNIKWKE